MNPEDKKRAQGFLKSKFSKGISKENRKYYQSSVDQNTHFPIMKTSHEKALTKKGTKVSNLVKGKEGKVGDKGKMPKREFGAKNNDSKED